jgi:hypothetical protein
MMAERGVGVDYSTLYRWVQYYAPECVNKGLHWGIAQAPSALMRAPFVVVGEPDLEMQLVDMLGTSSYGIRTRRAPSDETARRCRSSSHFPIERLREILIPVPTSAWLPFGTVHRGRASRFSFFQWEKSLA